MDINKISTMKMTTANTIKHISHNQQYDRNQYDDSHIKKTK